MKKEDEFEGKSWLNVLAGITFIGGIFLPFIAAYVMRADIPPWCFPLAWFVFVLLVTIIIAAAARTQERLARIEKHLGFDRGYVDTAAEKSEQKDGPDQ